MWCGSDINSLMVEQVWLAVTNKAPAAADVTALCRNLSLSIWPKLHPKLKLIAVYYKPGLPPGQHSEFKFTDLLCRCFSSAQVTYAHDILYAWAASQHAPILSPQSANCCLHHSTQHPMERGQLSEGHNQSWDECHLSFADNQIFCLFASPANQLGWPWPHE